MIARLPYVIVFLFVCGCAHVPQSTVKLCVLNPAESSTALLQRTRHVSDPTKYTVVTSVVFSFFGKDIPILGMLTIDEKAKMFMVAGYNHVGVKLIELSGDAKTEKLHYVMPALAKFGDLSKAVAELVRAVYFDRVPTADASEFERMDDRIVFEQHTPLHDLRWTVGGLVPAVTEKSCFEKKKLRWRVIYIEYDRSRQRVLPKMIEIINKTFHYRLRVTVKEIRA